jgi:hypothetical protein
MSFGDVICFIDTGYLVSAASPYRLLYARLSLHPIHLAYSFHSSWL